MKILPLALALFATAASASEARLDQREQRLAERHAIISFEHTVLPHEREIFAASGVRIVSELGDRTYVARIRNGRLPRELGITLVREIEPESKIYPSARQALTSLEPFVKAQIVFHRDISFEQASEVIRMVAGVAERNRFSYPNTVVATLPRAAIERLAERDEVAQVHSLRRRIVSQNLNAANLSSVTPLHSPPYDLTGRGVIVTIFDVGNAQADHPEFEGRVLVQTAGTTEVHPTHVTGTVTAKGTTPNAKGMAPGATVYQYAVDNDFLEVKDVAFPKWGSRVDNNSWGYTVGWQFNPNRTHQFEWWGNDEFGAYALESAGVDALTREHGTLIVYSAGNDNGDSGPSAPPFAHYHGDLSTIYCRSANGSGTDCAAPCNSCETVTHPTDGPFNSMSFIGAAKNVVAVGAVNTFPSIASFSSRGPAKDGRIKPDVVAKGTSQFSTFPGSSYGSLQGTSMAAPVVAGISALLIEQWKRSFGGANPTPENLRALLIHSTQDLGNAGPDYTYGFGLVNAKNAVDTILADGGSGTHIRRESVTQGALLEYSLTLPAAAQGRLTLVWSDPENTPYPPAALINDLDLTVVDSSGATILPFVLDPNTPTTPATRGVNVRDNVERVEWTATTGGVYTVRVRGTRIASIVPQTFTLVSSHSFGAAQKPCVDPFEPNDAADTAFGRMPRETTFNAALCTESDVDFYRFRVDRAGPVTVTLTATGTPLRVTISSGSLSTTSTVAANSTGTAQLILPGSGAIAETAVLVRVEAAGPRGETTEYTIKTSFQSSSPVRRRPVRR